MLILSTMFKVYNRAEYDTVINFVDRRTGHLCKTFETNRQNCEENENTNRKLQQHCYRSDRFR